MSKLARWAASLSPKLGARMGERVLFLQHTQQVVQKSLLRSSVERGLAGWIKNTLSLLENRELGRHNVRAGRKEISCLNLWG